MKTITIAHRGASAVAPENTLSAFEQAVKIGADLIELDVRFSRDKVVVVFHDRFLDRTTNGRGTVEERTLTELKKLDAGSWFSPRWAGVRIPTLKEVIQTIYPSRTGLYIELKIDEGREEIRPELVEEVLAIIEKLSFQQRAFLASFDKTCLQLSKERRPSVRTGLIFRDENIWEESSSTGFENIDILCARWSITNLFWVQQAHQAKRIVFAWTVDQEDKLKPLLECGVDGVASNSPAWLIETLKKME